MIQDSMRQEMRIIARQMGLPTLEEQLSRIPEDEYGELAKRMLLHDIATHYQRRTRNLPKAHEL